MTPNRFLGSLRSDLPASFVVFLVAVPLSLGIAVASGAPVMAGLIAAVVGGIVVGLVAGAPLQVSGPAAGLTVIVFSQVQQFGWATVCAITVAAGLLQLALGLLKVARGALAIAPAVVHGMLAGIGIVIALAQLHVVLGGSPESSALRNLAALPEQIRTLHGSATAIGILTILILISWRFVPARMKTLPGPLVAITAATLAAALAGWEAPRVDLPDNLFGDHVLPRLPADWGAFAVAVLTTAIIASVESLLCAVATDKLHTGKRAHLDRELMGQGAGNVVSGLLGGLPITGVIVRSSANITAGAKTQTSAILHGVWVLVFTLLLGSLIERIPLAALAALLVFVGVNLVNPHHIRELLHHREAPIYFATVAGVVFLNLLAGVGIGIGLSVLMTLRRLANTRIQIEERAGRWHARIEGTLTFASVPQLVAALGQVPGGAPVDIDLSVDFMDHAAFEALHGWRRTHERAGGKVDIDETHEDWYQAAATGAPREQKSPPARALPAVFGRWRTAANDRASLLDGIREFERSKAASVRSIFSELARRGQSPRELFITSCESQVMPTTFTDSAPGDLLTIRNFGNLVPRQTSGPEPSGDSHSVGAAIEYAVDTLGIETIVVCGHSGCRAMAALLEDGGRRDQPHLRAWLAHARPSLERFRSGGATDAPEVADRLSQVHVAQQLDNLRTYPRVAEAEQAGRLRLVGLYFDINEARVFLYDEARQEFLPVADREPALSA